LSTEYQLLTTHWRLSRQWSEAESFPAHWTAVTVTVAAAAVSSAQTRSQPHRSTAQLRPVLLQVQVWLGLGGSGRRAACCSSSSA